MDAAAVADPFLILSIPHNQTVSQRYGVYVRAFAMGQQRIQLTDSRQALGQWVSDHGDICREL